MTDDINTTNDTTNTNESSIMTNNIDGMTANVNVLLKQAVQGQANVIQYLAGYINALEARIGVLEANQTITNDEDEGPITRETISEMIGDRLDEFTRDYSFTSAVREIADEVVQEIDWSDKIDAEDIVREGLRDIL